MMKKESFFKTEEGRLSIAGIIIFAAFPIYLIGQAAGAAALQIGSFFMVVAGMMYSPIYVYLLPHKDKEPAETE